MIIVQSWSKESERMLEDFVALGHSTLFCPNRVRSHLQGLRTGYQCDLDELLLAEALSFSLSQPNNEHAFDDALREQLPCILKYQIQGSVQRKPGEFMWDCFHASPLAWVDRYGITQSHQFQLKVNLGVITNDEVVALLSRHLLRAPSPASEAKGVPIQFEHNNKIKPDSKGAHSKERETISRRGMRALGKSFVQRISDSALRNGMVWDISQRLVALLGVDMPDPDTGAPLVIEILCDCLTAFELQPNSQYAIEKFSESLIPAFSRLWRLQVRCTTTGELWPKLEMGFVSWAAGRPYTSYEVFDVAAEPHSCFEERLEAFILAPAVLSRRELTIFGVPLPGMQKPLDMHKDPLWPQR